MLHQKALVLALGVSQTLELSHGAEVWLGHSADENPVGHLLAPAGKHERVNAERSRYVLYEDPRLLGELDGLELELQSVLLDSLRTRFRHRCPP